MSRLRLPAVVALVVIALDQWTKWLILRQWPLPQTGEITIIPRLLSLFYIRNEGVAFGMFQGVPQLFTVTSLLIVAGLIYFYLTQLPANSRLVAVLVGMIIGGALGNVIDRLRFGYVVDFIKTFDGRFWIFNVADSAVSVAVISLAIIMFLQDRRAPAPATLSRDDGHA